MITHIKHVNDDKRTWCDEELNSEFSFTVEQACVNGIHFTKEACMKCTDKIIEILNAGAGR